MTQSFQGEKFLMKCLENNDKACRNLYQLMATQPAFTCSKLTIETREQGVKYVQSKQ